MNQEIHLFLIRRALIKGILTREQVVHFLEIANREEKDLLDLLLQKGVLDKNLLSLLRLSAQQDRYWPENPSRVQKENQQIYEILKKTRVLPNLDELFQVAQKLINPEKSLRLHELLIKRGLITSQKVESLLGIEEKAILCCNYCHYSLPISPFEPWKTYICFLCLNPYERESFFSPLSSLSKNTLPFEERYEILDLLGEGGMGVVYKIYDKIKKKELAVKILESYKDSNRFYREIQVARSLKHENIVSLEDVGEWEGSLYYTMEYVEGNNLRDIVEKKGAFSVSEVLEILDQVGAALVYAHQQGIIHRDIKPENILMDAQGKAFLTDFGLAKKITENVRITKTGMVVGSPEFMSPEQALGEELDFRTDQYSLAATIYFMLTGHPPFQHEEVTKLLMEVVQKNPQPLSLQNPEVSKDLEWVILKKGMAKDPHQRFESLQDFLLAFSLAAKGEKIPLSLKGLAKNKSSSRNIYSHTTSRRNFSRFWIILFGMVLSIALGIAGALWFYPSYSPNKGSASVQNNHPVAHNQPPKQVSGSGNGTGSPGIDNNKNLSSSLTKEKKKKEIFQRIQLLEQKKDYYGLIQEIPKILSYVQDKEKDYYTLLLISAYDKTNQVKKGWKLLKHYQPFDDKHFLETQIFKIQFLFYQLLEAFTPEERWNAFFSHILHSPRIFYFFVLLRNRYRMTPQNLTLYQNTYRKIHKLFREIENILKKILKQKSFSKIQRTQRKLFPEILYFQGIFYLLYQNYYAAYKCFKGATKYLKSDLLYFGIAISLFYSQNARASLAYLKKVHDSSVRDNPIFDLFAALIYFQNNDYTLAFQFLNQAKEKGLQQFPLWQFYGFFYKKLEKYPQAYESLKKSLKNNSYNFNTYRLLAHVCIQLNRFKEAHLYISKYLELLKSHRWDKSFFRWWKTFWETRPFPLPHRKILVELLSKKTNLRIRAFQKIYRELRRGNNQDSKRLFILSIFLIDKRLLVYFRIAIYRLKKKALFCLPYLEQRYQELKKYKRPLARSFAQLILFLKRLKKDGKIKKFQKNRR
ncbi:MAG: hypothetical protein D6785_06120 [Planctomycetota bacterium]|nr:MAG: hypothetical protein D6785_06120 [Planctomycetota bacterium]